MVNYTLCEVKTSSDIKAFLEIPLVIYDKKSRWIRPIDAEIEAVFDPEKNKLLHGGEAIRWIAKDRSGRVVGRIAAFYNTAQVALEGTSTGGCGFFEAIDDQELANTLFDAAREWLLSKGMESMDGPINFGSRDKFWGVLTSGYEHDPIYGMNYNPEYYPKLIEGYGFKNYYNQHSYYMGLDGSAIAPTVAMRHERLLSTGEYTFRQMNNDDFKTLPRNFVEIYNKAWSNFTGVAPMSVEDGENILRDIRPIMEKRLIHLAYHKDRMIGFFIMIPEINRAIRHLNGKFGLFSKLKFLYHVKIRKSCDSVIGLIFSVTPEYQGKGLESGIISSFNQLINSQKHHYKHIELTWMGDFNPLMMRMVEKYVGASRYKIHTTYRYLFDREKPFTRAPKVSISRKQEAFNDANMK